MKFTALIGGERLEIELHRRGPHTIEAQVGSRKYTLESRAVEPGVFWLNWNNRSLELAVTRDGDGYIVSIDGRRVPVDMLDARTALRRAARQGHEGIAEIRAPMPGKIVKVLVEEGAEVRANQGMVVMEAMKMQNEIKSPKSGIVRKLSVTAGSAVISGDLLVVVE